MAGGLFQSVRTGAESVYADLIPSQTGEFWPGFRGENRGRMGTQEEFLHSSIVLRDVTESDLPILFEHQKDPEASRMAAFVSRDPADRDAFLTHWRRILSDPTLIVKAILWKGHVAGTVGSYSRDGKSQVTYWIGKEFWGNGIATQALTELLRIVNRRPLYASTASDNAASIRVLEKCGFAVRGSAKAFAKARGAEIDEVLFELAP